MMKRNAFWIVMLIAGLIPFAATMTSAQEMTSTQAKMDKQPVLWSAENLKWVPLDAGVPGVMHVMLWGDDSKGAYGGMTKFPAGFKAPLHSHTYATKIVVIKGAYTYNGKEYGPGSYVYVPGGFKHESGGVKNSESIFFIEQEGKFDMKPAEPQAGQK